MPVVEIRDTIEGLVTMNEDGFGYMTRRINLQEGHKFEVQSIDIFNDNGLMLFRQDPVGARNAAYQLFVSPYPMQQKGGVWGSPSLAGGQISEFPGPGQNAGEPNVLYKEIGITDIVQNNQQQLESKMLITRFPNDAVAATPTFTFFTPHVYLTVMVWNDPETPEGPLTLPINMSLYMKVKQTKAASITAAIGRYAELLDSQVKLLESTAVVYNPINVPGDTFPSWKFGGIRSELMLSGPTALRYFNRVAANESQDMVTQNDLFTAYRESTNMAAFDEPFGDAALNLPEWISLENLAGVTSGVIRPYPPPLKYADNGNTLMF